MVRLTVTDELLAQAIRDTDWARVDALTDEEIEAAVAADPDAVPIREPEDIAAAAVATVRAATGLSQEEFAAAYAIPLHTLRDWETARAAPDAVATAYLRVIRRDPRAVARARRLTRALAPARASVNMTPRCRRHSCPPATSR